jgi:hypothetical protein
LRKGQFAKVKESCPLYEEKSGNIALRFARRAGMVCWFVSLLGIGLLGIGKICPLKTELADSHFLTQRAQRHKSTEADCYQQNDLLVILSRLTTHD